MGKTKKFLGDVAKVAASNVLTVLAGVIAGFVLPKIIGVTNYGYFKTFSLYIAYVSILQIGIEEGIYLLFGGKTYDDLEKGKFRYYSRFLVALEASLSVLFIIVSLIFLNGEYKFIFACVSLYVLFQNITSFYQYVSQITGRFNELSIRNVLKSILTILSVFGMWLYYHFANSGFLSYKIYTVLYVAIFAILCFWYIFTYRDITFGKSVKPEGEESISSLIKIGLPLLVSNLCSTLIFIIDRQFVSIFFDIDTYGAYAFAYNMLQLITVATSSVATVIYPTLKRSNPETLIKEFDDITSVFSAFVLFCVCVYFPLHFFINVFFSDQTKFIDSLPIFRIMLPSLVISCSITVIFHNYFKTLNLNRHYFVIVVIVLLFSVGANFAAYYIFKTTFAISWASVAVTLFWYLLSAVFLHIKFKVKWVINFVYCCLCMTSFYLISFFFVWWLGLILYFAVFAALTLCFHFKKIKKFAIARFSKKSG